MTDPVNPRDELASGGDTLGVICVRLQSGVEASRVAIALKPRWSVDSTHNAVNQASIALSDLMIIDLSTLLSFDYQRLALPVVVMCEPEELEALEGVMVPDDVVVRPWTGEELRHRVERVTVPRRRRIGATVLGWSVRTIILSWSGRERAVTVSRQLFALFDLLIRRRDQPVSRDLIRQVLDRSVDGVASRSIDMAISRLRHTLRDLTDGFPVTVEIRANHGVGYSLHADYIPLVDNP